jgi:hypothetical protein
MIGRRRCRITGSIRPTFAPGRNAPQLGAASNAGLLFVPGEPLYGRTFTINSLSLGYIHDFTRSARTRAGIGGLISVYRYASILDAPYGDGPISYMLFLRIKL